MAQTQTRMTKQRMVILEELRKVHSHPTADELYAMVRARMPRISLEDRRGGLDPAVRRGYAAAPACPLFGLREDRGRDAASSDARRGRRQGRRLPDHFFPHRIRGYLRRVCKDFVLSRAGYILFPKFLMLRYGRGTFSAGFFLLS